MIRLPRGRDPLRGPFGRMLDDKMRQSDIKGTYTADEGTISFLQSLSGGSQVPVQKSSGLLKGRGGGKMQNWVEPTPMKVIRDKNFLQKFASMVQPSKLATSALFSHQRDLNFHDS